MFIDEIQKDEIGYVNKAKEKVKEYFLDFFDEKYKDQIEQAMSFPQFVFIDKNHEKRSDRFYTLKIDRQLTTLYSKWIEKCFPTTKLDYVYNIEEINLDKLMLFEELLYSDKKEDFDKLNEVYQYITNSNDNITKKQINSCKKIFEDEFEEKINEVNFIEFQMLKSNEKASLNKSDEEIVEENKYIKSIYQNLDKYAQTLLLKKYRELVNMSNISGCFQTFQHSFELANGDVRVDHFYFTFYKNIETITQHTFIHELMHLISYNHNLLKDFDGKFKDKHGSPCYIFCKCGVEEQRYSIGFIKEEVKSTLLNEILTDYFAFLITQKMQQNGDEFFLSSLNNSSYSQCFVLVKPLMDRYFDKFKDCFMSKTPCGMQNLIGEQNLNDLNTLVEDFLGYCNYLRTNKLGLAHNFEEGLKEARKPESLYVNQVVTKYNKCFLRMENLMKNIDEYINNKDNVFLKTN